MNWDVIEGNWDQLKGNIRKKWGKLTDNDLDIVKGQKDQFVGLLQQKYGLSQDEISEGVDSIASSYRTAEGQAKNGAEKASFKPDTIKPVKGSQAQYAKRNIEQGQFPIINTDPEHAPDVDVPRKANESTPQHPTTEF